MRNLLLLVAMLFSFSGCALQAVTPVHHTESGDFVITGAITEPGVLYIPKITGAVTVGVGGFSDITIGAGTAILNFTAFTTLRFWVKFLEMSFETHYQTSVLESGSLFGSDAISFLSLTPRIGKGLTEDEGFAFGLQVPILLILDDQQFEPVTVFGGAYATYGWRVKTVPWLAFQTEIAASPLILESGANDFDSPIAPWFHVNFGVTFWPSRSASAPAEEEYIPREKPQPLL